MSQPTRGGRKNKIKKEIHTESALPICIKKRKYNALGNKEAKAPARWDLNLARILKTITTETELRGHCKNAPTIRSPGRRGVCLSEN